MKPLCYHRFCINTATTFYVKGVPDYTYTWAFCRIHNNAVNGLQMEAMTAITEEEFIIRMVEDLL